MKTMQEKVKKYILTSPYALRGWKLLPYAVQNLFTARTEFFRKPEFELLKACDGQTDIDWDSLTDIQRKYYVHWEKNGFIRAARPGDCLRPIQQYRFYPVRFKEKVLWSITGKCNYKCKHCFMSAPHAAQGEPSWDQLMIMLEAFSRCGIRSVSLTGGEPMVRKDFWQLVDAIQEKDIIIDTLFSNGQLITEAFLDQLDKRHIRPVFQFSFDGVGYHDWMRGIAGAEKTVIDAIGRCRSRGYPLSVSMVLFKENAGSIRESVNLLASLGVQQLKISNASPAGEWANQKDHYLTQAQLYEAFLEYIPHFFEDGKPLSLGLEGFFNYDKRTDTIAAYNEKDIPEDRFGKVLMCGHVRRQLYVSPQGNILPCMSMVGTPIEDQFPNMLETSLEKILETESPYMDIINFRISDFMSHNPECPECEYRTQCCGGCRAIAVRDHPTDYLAKDLDVCEYFKGGWKDKKDALIYKIMKGEPSV